MFIWADSQKFNLCSVLITREAFAKKNSLKCSQRANILEVINKHVRGLAGVQKLKLKARVYVGQQEYT